jgi:hypothetical protein
MRWMALEDAQPRLAELGRQRLVEPGVVLVGTIRADGTPRISPVEPFVMEGDLWLSMMWQSWKATDLARDPRVLVHSIITSRDGSEGEYKVRGIAQPEDDATVQHRYAAAVADELGWRPEPGRFHLFAVDITEVTVIRYDAATGDQFVARWPSNREFVRRGTSATTVGVAEPYRDLLNPSAT